MATSAPCPLALAQDARGGAASAGNREDRDCPCFGLQGSYVSATFYTSSSLLLPKRMSNHHPGCDQCCSLL